MGYKKYTFLGIIISLLAVSFAFADETQIPELHDQIPGFSIIQEAIDNKDPSILIEGTEPGPERDFVLAMYATLALDTSALSQIEDNRIHDGVITQLVTVAYGRLDLAAKEDYCKQLRGNYEYGGEDLPEEEFIANKNICNMAVAATNQLVNDNNECEEHVQATFESEYDKDDPFYEEDLRDNMADCKKLVRTIQDAKAALESAETSQEIIDLAQIIFSENAADFSGCDYSGVYSTNWGEMTIRHNGNSLTAVYTHDKGRIAGSVSGNKMTGTWSEYPSYAGPTDAGPVEFTFGDDCGSFDGFWAYENTKEGWVGPWGGSTKIREEPYPQVTLDDATAELLQGFAPEEESVPAEPEVIEEIEEEEIESEPEVADLAEETKPDSDLIAPVAPVPEKRSAIQRILGFLFGWLG